ncbi:hypothetical protein BC628DRAFT_871305 [Trametes gibbosa]|nr:hypothetical protein BC628DRAFT_871305 [Trametes gibbosa]
MLSFKDRLSAVEGEFLVALIKGGDALSAFNDRWEELVFEIDLALEHATLDTETASLAHAVASRCATLAETSVDLFSSYNSLTTELMGELDTLMSDLTIHERATRSMSHPVATEEENDRWSRFFPPSPNKPLDTSITSRKRKSRPDCSPPSGTRSPKRKCPPHCASHPTLSLPVLSVDSAPSPRAPNNLSFPSLLSPSITHQSRKRRLSDTDMSHAPDRRKRPHIGPRLHAVSDSFATHLTQSADVPAPSRQLDAHEACCAKGVAPTSHSVIWPSNTCVDSPTGRSSLSLQSMELSLQSMEEASTVDFTWSSFDGFLRGLCPSESVVPTLPPLGADLESQPVDIVSDTSPHISYATDAEPLFSLDFLLPLDQQDNVHLCLPNIAESQISCLDWDLPLDFYGHVGNTPSSDRAPDAIWDALVDRSTVDWVCQSSTPLTPYLSPCPSNRSEDSDDGPFPSSARSGSLGVDNINICSTQGVRDFA